MKKILALLALSFCGLAHASLIDIGNKITDTSTGHVWFDLTTTLGNSYNQMQANFLNVNSQFYGYQYATKADVMTLWNDAGYTGNFYDSAPANGASVTMLFNLFGQTGTNCCARADGMFNDQDANSSVSFAYLVPNLQLGRVLTNYFSSDATDWAGGSNELGSYIFKASGNDVPEPAGISLIGLGLAAALLARRRKPGAR